MTAQEKLESIVGEQIKNENEEKEEENKKNEGTNGFLSSFNKSIH